MLFFGNKRRAIEGKLREVTEKYETTVELLETMRKDCKTALANANHENQRASNLYFDLLGCRQDNAKVAAAIEKYAQHLHLCNVYIMDKTLQTCTCGLDQIMEELRR